jgi:hypothetical protein
VADWVLKKFPSLDFFAFISSFMLRIDACLKILFFFYFNCGYLNANDNTNPYRNMVMDAMRMNQGNGSQCPIVE